MVPTSRDQDAKIVQFADDTKTLPDGSKIMYAESDTHIVLYRKVPFEKGTTYVYDRKSGQIQVDGKPGSNKEKRDMLKFGAYMVEHATDDDLVTLSIKNKPGKK